MRAAEHDDEIAGGDGEDVGAGDGGGTSEFECGFGADDGVEGVAGKREVDVGVAFGFVEEGGGDEDGAVAAVGEAIVKKEAEGSAAGGGASDLLVGDGFLNDLVELGARMLVEIEGESGFGRV